MTGAAPADSRQALRLRGAPAAAVAALVLLLLAVDLVCAARWGRNLPLAEDWNMVAVLTGHEADTLSWLWSQNNEHRLPLPRLLYWALLEAVPDFRAGMVLSQLLLALAAAALARAAWQARGGRSDYGDLLFPAALLHVGHGSNLFWGWQLQFVASVTLACLLLACVIAAPGLLRGRRAGLAATCVVLLPVSGANGLLLGPPMALWLAWHAWRHRRGDDARASPKAGALLAAAALASLALTAVYFVGYERPSWSPPAPTVGQFARMLLKILANAFGPGVRDRLGLAEVLAVGVFAASIGVLVRAAMRCTAQEGLRAYGLVAFGAGCAALAGGIAWGRGADPTPMPDRYALLSAVSLCVAGAVWQLYGGARTRRFAPVALVLLLLAYLPANLRSAHEWRDWYTAGMAAVQADIAADVPIPELARRHHPFLMHWSEPRLRAGMDMLHAAGLGPFRQGPTLTAPRR